LRKWLGIVRERGSFFVNISYISHVSYIHYKRKAGCFHPNFQNILRPIPSPFTQKEPPKGSSPLLPYLKNATFVCKSDDLARKDSDDAAISCITAVCSCEADDTSFAPKRIASASRAILRASFSTPSTFSV